MSAGGVLEQHIAVFGESGSGKTVMLSAFYGATQESHFAKSSLYRVVADDIGQGSQLHKNYLDMRDSAIRPEPTRFRSTSYAFSLKLKDGDPKVAATRPYSALRLVWHDYPGEWFEQGVSGPDEARRRVTTFRSLLGSDVALLLVDGQRLLDNEGQEERYLKSLLGNLRNAVLNLKDDLLEDGKRLVKFPRIWILALSKADLLPAMDVEAFRDLMIKRAAGELADLREVLGGMVESSDAMAVGEDFLLLSSAKFDPNKIDVTAQVGLDLVVPLASVLPFERHVKWIEEKKAAAKVGEELLDGVAAVAAALLGKPKREQKGKGKGKVADRGRKLKLPGPKEFIKGLLGDEVIPAAVSVAAKLAGDKLRARNAAAMGKHDYMAAVLGQFQENLETAEGRDVRPVLLRSLR